MILKSSILLSLLFVCFHGIAQSQMEKANSKSTSLKPYYPEEKKFSKKQMRKDAAKTTVDLQREHHERIEAVLNERRKAERLMLKPQYSDPMYFGHKRPPKKHSPKKMRYCKECGIRH